MHRPEIVRNTRTLRARTACFRSHAEVPRVPIRRDTVGARAMSAIEREVIARDELMQMTAAARAAMADSDRITTVGDSATPRFELFHAASSLCSQKARTVLHEKQLSYRSNDMLILSSMGANGLVPAE